MASMLSFRLFNRSLCAVSFFLCATSVMQAQALADSKDLPAETKALLTTSPALVAASVFPGLGRLPADPKVRLQIDEKRQMVSFINGKGVASEFVCDRLEDGFRRTYPGTHRSDTSLKCFQRTRDEKGAPQLIKWDVLVEREGDRVFAELSANSQRVFAGTLLPSSLPNWVPDFSTIDCKFQEILGSQMGPRGPYQFRILVVSRLSPDEFLKAIKLTGKEERLDNRAIVRRAIGEESVTTVWVDWDDSKDERRYYLSFGGRGLDPNSNEPYPLSTTAPKPAPKKR